MSTADSGNFSSFGGPNEGFGGSESLSGTPLNPNEVSQEEVDALSNQLSSMSPEATRTVYDSYRDNKESTPLPLSLAGSPTTTPGGMGSGFESGPSQYTQENIYGTPGEVAAASKERTIDNRNRVQDAKNRGADADTVREVAAEGAWEAMNEANIDAVKFLVVSVFGSDDLTKEELQKKSEALLSIFEKEGNGSVAQGMQLLQKEYARLQRLEEKGSLSPEDSIEKKRILDLFVSEGLFTEAETQQILGRLISDEYKAHLNSVQKAETDYIVASAARENKSNAVVDVLLGITDDATAEAVEAATLEAAEAFAEEELKKNPNSALGKRLMGNVEDIRARSTEIKRAELLREQEEIKQIRKTTNITSQTAATLVEFGVGARVLAGLPPEGQAAVQNAVSRGGGRVLGALLSGGVSHNNEELTGQVSGQYISLNFSDSGLFLTGENAADRANQGKYRIDPPTPQEFEKVLIHSIGEQNRMPYIAQHAEQAGAIWESFAGRPDDEQLPEAKNIDLFRNFLILLIGEGNPDEGEEGRRLQELGIITQGVESVDRTRLELFVRALQKYISSDTVMHDGDSGGPGGTESPSFDYRDAVTLARIWDKTPSRFPESVTELKKLTALRLQGGDIHTAEHV